MSIVNVHNEWDPLEEIIVGSALHAAMPTDDPGFDLARRLPDHSKRAAITINSQIRDETEEDLLRLVETLTKLGVSVRRPSIEEPPGRIKTPDWEVDAYFPYCPRDIFFAIGQSIIECPSVFRSRYFESNVYKHILLDYLRSGSRWFSAPKPRLLHSGYRDGCNGDTIINEHEPVFDAANVIRAGRDLFYLVSDSGNDLGCDWLQTMLGSKYRVHACRNLYHSLHIDTTICLLRPGLFLANPKWVTEHNLPPLLRTWTMITCPEMIEKDYSTFPPMASPWLGMNLLMVNPNLALVDQNQTNLIAVLKKHNIDIVPVLLRHGRILGGGPHCVTLDIRRKGVLESYF